MNRELNSNDAVYKIMWSRTTKLLRNNASVDRLAAYLVKTNPDFDTTELVKKGYIKHFPYSSDTLWAIRDLWYTVTEKEDEKRFRILLKEVEHVQC